MNKHIYDDLYTYYRVELSMVFISIVLPTFNEKENVGILFSEIRNKVKADGYEIVVVDDNSPDGTWAEALDFISDGDVVIRRLGMKGLSSAIIDGILFSLGRHAVVMDADLQHPPETINSMIKKIGEEDYDVIVGSRYTHGGSIIGWSRSRLIISKGATLIAKIFLPYARKISDPMSGFFMVKKHLIENNRRFLNPMGFKILLEILEKCRPPKIAEVPYVFKPRMYGKSKLGFKNILAFILHVLRLSGWRPIRFVIVGLSGAAVNLFILWFFIRFFPVLALALFALGSVIAIEISTLWNFTLHELWTFKDRRVGSLKKRITLFHLAVLPGIIAQYISSISIRYGLTINPLTSQFIGIIIGFPVNYLLSELGIWKSYKSRVIRCS